MWRMEPPSSFEAESVRREKLKVWRAISSDPILNVVRGQYGPGMVDGKQVVGYREEERVNPRVRHGDLCGGEDGD